MKVLVTGGAGYIGTELVFALSQADDVSELTIYDNLARRNPNLFIVHRLPAATIRFVPADILDTRRLREEVARADLIYHLAARVTTPFGQDDPHAHEQVNHWGTAELSYLVEESSAKRVVYVSSTSVYGASDKPAGRDSVPNPSTPYGWSKLRGERTLARLGGRHEIYILRCANVYGFNVSMRFDSVVNRFMFDAQFTNRLTVNGSGQQHRPFVHLRTACRVLLAFGRGQLPPGSYDLVTRNTSILELARTVQSLYTGLELLFIEQDLKLRNLEVLPDPRLQELAPFPPAKSLRDDLDELRRHFAFAPVGLSRAGAS